MKVATRSSSDNMDWLESKGECPFRRENHMRSSRLLLPTFHPSFEHFCWWALVILLLASPSADAGRNAGADGKFSERKSSHFVLLQDVAIERYSGTSGSRRFERDVLEILEGARRSVGDLLGIRPRQRVVVVLYDPDDFDLRFADQFA